MDASKVTRPLLWMFPVDDSSNNRLGSSVEGRLACEVLGSSPVLPFLSLPTHCTAFYAAFRSVRVPVVVYIFRAPIRTCRLSFSPR